MSHSQKPTDLGDNRTGMATSPVDSKDLRATAERAVPIATLDPPIFRSVHEELSRQAPPVGSMAPPTTIKGVAKAVAAAVKGDKANVLLDKLGERLAFERNGVRLYDALMIKLAAASPHDTGITRDQLEEIREDELRHFGIVRRAIEEMGADPTVVTPCADISGVLAMGLVQVLTDPRTTLTQGLDAILTAELADHAGWELLVRLADGLGKTDMASRFRTALAEEESHLLRVRGWLGRALTGQAGIEQPLAPPHEGGPWGK